MKLNSRRRPSLVLRYFLFLFVVGCGSGVQVASSAAETGLIREVFACNFHEGAGMEELMAARDNMVATLPETGVPPVEAFVWTPFKGNFSVDLLWFNNHENLNSWGRSQDVWGSSPIGEQVIARFNEVGDCSSALVVRQTIYEGSGWNGGAALEPPALIRSMACKLHPGKNINDVEAFTSSVRSTLDGLGLHDEFIGYMGVPLVSAAAADVYFYGVHDNASDYATRMTALMTSDEGQALAAELNGVMDCNVSLWWGQNVVEAP